MRAFAAVVLLLSWLLVACGPKRSDGDPPSDAAVIADAAPPVVVDAGVVDGNVAGGHSGLGSVSGGGTASSANYKIISTTSPGGGPAASSSVRATTGVVGGTQP